MEGGEKPLVSVKTKQNVPKNSIFQCMDDIRNVVARAPITAGDVLIENVAETGVEVVATKDVGIDVGTST